MVRIKEVIKEIRTTDRNMLICSLVLGDDNQYYYWIKRGKMQDLIHVDEFAIMACI